MRIFGVATSLVVSLLWVTVAGGRAPEVGQPPKQAPVTAPRGPQVPQIQQQAAPILKHVGVAGPVPGGKETAGLVQLLAPSRDRLGTTVHLSSSHPNLASVPAGVLVPFNTSDAGFKVTTSAVMAPTSVTIEARVGAETKTATVIVRPPQLAALACNPQHVPVGTRTTCTAWLDGTAAAETFVMTTSPEYGNLMIPYIKVFPGEVRGSRPVPGLNDGPQPRAVTVNASYGGAARATQLTIGPAYLKAVTISDANFSKHGNFVGVVRVQLHAPAPNDFKLKMKPDPAVAMVNDYGAFVFTIPAGKNFADFDLAAQPAATDGPVKIDVIAGYHGAHDVKSTVLTALAARMIAFKEAPSERCPPNSFFGLISNCLNPVFPDPDGPGVITVGPLPPDGLRERLAVWLQGKAPAGGAEVALSYTATSVVNGPSAFRIPKNNWKEDFPVTVFPCPQAMCSGAVRATYLGQTRELQVRVIK